MKRLHTQLMVVLICVAGCGRVGDEPARPPERPTTHRTETVVPELLKLWPGDAPGSSGSPAPQPRLTGYFPDSNRANGTAVVICPGGGYGTISFMPEGDEPARWLMRLGVTAFVLKYRVAPHRHPASLQDAQRAVRVVRARAQEWGIDPHKIGIWGFSAGGHLAALASVHFEEGKTDAMDPGERLSSRPDFSILAYPVISMDELIVHAGSRDSLLGPKPTRKDLEFVSCERWVTARTPPAFLFIPGKDTVVPPENGYAYYDALVRFKVPAEVASCPEGKHGVGLGLNDRSVADWTERLKTWMRSRGLLPR